MPLLARTLIVCCLCAAWPPAAANTDSPMRLAFSESFTDSIVRSLEGGIGTCQALPAVYRFDCYRQNYRATASKMNGKPDYRDAQKALRHVENTLKSILRSYGDKAAPTIRSGGLTYKPVKPDAVSTAARAFDTARAEAVTILLRSDGRARVHFERIASVVGSNKLIIRSAIDRLLRRA